MCCPLRGSWLRLFFVAFVHRDDGRRVISLRKANPREENAMPKLKPGTIIPTAQEDAIITAAALSDPDAIPFTDAQWDAARPLVHSAAELSALFEKVDLPFAPIAKPEDLFDDPHLKATGGLADIKLPM